MGRRLGLCGPLDAVVVPVQVGREGMLPAAGAAATPLPPDARMRGATGEMTLAAHSTLPLPPLSHLVPPPHDSVSHGI